MSVVHVFLMIFILLVTETWTGDASRQKIISNPCDDKRIVLKTVLVNDTIENSFRLGCTSTLFTMSGGSSSVTWYSKRPLVNDVWLEFFFFYEQAIVLRFIKILLGYEPITVSLTCTLDLVLKNYSFSLNVDNRSFGACANSRKTYVCSVGRMKEFFKNLEHYKGGKSIVIELKKRAKELYKKWSDVCQLFKILEKNATNVYLLYYDPVTDKIVCTVSSSVPWRYSISINGSVINDTKTRYNRSDDTHTTVGSTSRKNGMHFVCGIGSPNGTNASQFLNIPVSTTLASILTSTREGDRDISIAVDAATTTEVKKLIKKVLPTQKEMPTFGTGPIISVVIMVSTAIILMGSFVFREELASFIHKLQEVPTESPYKDIVMTIER